MIEAWRNVWHTRTNATTDPAFPFGFVQVSSIETSILIRHTAIAINKDK